MSQLWISKIGEIHYTKNGCGKVLTEEVKFKLAIRRFGDPIQLPAVQVLHRSRLDAATRCAIWSANANILRELGHDRRIPSSAASVLDRPLKWLARP